jgi:peptidyl-prolyl cis-trans isomerase A (cyclophilin A)
LVISALNKGLRLVLVGALIAAIGSPVATATEALRTASAATNDVIAVQIRTELGPITLELHAKQAPITVANFLRYVDSGKYDGATFYRTLRRDNQRASDIPIQVIQGGVHGGAFSSAANTPPETFPPIAHETTRETGLKHVDGVISMARAAPGSATSEFFICIGDNPALDFGGMRNPDGQGFAAFGRVTAGMEIIRRIQAHASDAPLPETLHAVKGQILKPAVAILSVRRIEG